MARIFTIIALGVLLPASAFAGGKKAPPMSVSFHLQSDPGDRQVFKQLTAGKEIFFSKSAVLTEKNFVAFRPFPSEDDQSYGVVFQLDKVGASRLQAISAANRGKLLVALVNGQVRDAVLVDQPVDDGLIVIWKRVALPEIRQADQLMPRIGEDPKAWKKRIKETR